MANRTAVGIVPEPMGVDDDVGPYNFLDEVEHIIRLGKEHRQECPGCPACDIIGTFVAQIRRETTASDFAMFRRVVFGENYGGPGFGYIENDDGRMRPVAIGENVAKETRPLDDPSTPWD